MEAVGLLLLITTLETLDSLAKAHILQLESLFVMEIVKICLRKELKVINI